MSMQGKKPSGREIVRGENDENFIQRRARAFTDRSREPGDATTWAVVLGALMCTLLMICFSVGGHARLALLAAALTAIWIFVVSRYGRVNVFSILWGAATTDSGISPNHQVIFRATTALAAIAAAAIVIDAVTGWGFTWYSVVLGATILIYLGVAFRAGYVPSR